MAQLGVSVATHSDEDLPTVSRAQSSLPVDMITYLDEWLDTPGGGRLCLLGDYGTGKTSFCQYYTARRAPRYLEHPPTERIPLLLPLHRYTKAVDCRAMVTDFLANECHIGNLRLSTFENLLAAGHFLIFLDGFDEMARYVDHEVRYRTIVELAYLARRNSKVVLTGRPSYFPTHEELEQVLTADNKGDTYVAARAALDELV